MARPGDSITYTTTTPPDSPITEDISNVGEVVIEVFGASGDEYNTSNNSGNGGYAQGTFGVSSSNTLYIWVASFESGQTGDGRFQGSNGGAQGIAGGGSTEVSLFSDNQTNSSNPSSLVGGGGGGGAFRDGTSPADGGSGARESNKVLGGAGGTSTSPDGGDGQGYVNSAGSNTTTIVGGGNSGGTDGKVVIDYKEGSLSLPEPPTNLTATVQ